MKRKIILFLTAILFLVPTVCAAANFSYTPMEEIPGFGRPTDFVSYIMAIYKFGLWTIGIAALLMITIGGFMYLTSAGNTSQTGKAKGIIYDAIAGIILALSSWLLLYVINPDLVRIQPLKPLAGAPGLGAAGVPGAGGGPAGTTQGYKAACPDVSSTNPIDFSKASSDEKISLDSACDKYDFSNSAGVDPKILKTIAQLESSCGANKGPSSSGAYGLMQILPSTASSMAGRVISGQELINDDKLSIELAAKYIKTYSGTTCVSAAKDKDAAIFGGYNSGYGCGSGACSSDKHALCASSDCSGALAFECCVNPGGLDESVNYAWNGVGLLNKQK